MAIKDKADERVVGVRLDKWLWAARFFRTRTLCQDNIELGRVRMKGVRLKASREVRIGDELEIFRGEEKYTVIVRALSDKRGGAAVAQTLYEETPASMENRLRIKENSRLMPMPGSDYSGRPTKRDGRRIREFMDEFNPARDW